MVLWLNAKFFVLRFSAIFEPLNRVLDMEFEMKRFRIALSLVLLCLSASSYAGSKTYDFDIHYAMSEQVKIVMLDNKDGGPIVFSKNRYNESATEGEINFTCTDMDYSSSDFFYLAIYYKQKPYTPSYIKIPLRWRSYRQLNTCYVYGARGDEKLRCTSYWFW